MDDAPVCPGCGAEAEWEDNHWVTFHSLDCTWMRDPNSERYDIEMEER